VHFTLLYLTSYCDCLGQLWGILADDWNNLYMYKYVEVNATIECLPAHTKEYLQLLYTIYRLYHCSFIYIFESSILGLILHPCTFIIITNSKQGTQRPYKRNIGARSRYHYCRGNALSITYSEVVSVSLVIEHTKRMRFIVSLSVSFTAVPYKLTFICLRVTSLSYDVAHRTVRS
jgi:hypothetical protein